MRQSPLKWKDLFYFEIYDYSIFLDSVFMGVFETLAECFEKKWTKNTQK